jgi:hypothetical protein
VLYKNVVFKNVLGQKVMVIEIPVLELKNRFYFTVQARLEGFIAYLYHNPQLKSSFSFKEYLKQKMRWPDYEELFQIVPFKHNA